METIRTFINHLISDLANPNEPTLFYSSWILILVLVVVIGLAVFTIYYSITTNRISRSLQASNEALDKAIYAINIVTDPTKDRKEKDAAKLEMNRAYDKALQVAKKNKTKDIQEDILISWATQRMLISMTEAQMEGIEKMLKQE